MNKRNLVRSFASSKGFTLVELLVVIGIIALLISILLPALNRARQSAQSVKCLSNLRQVSQAVMMYSLAGRDQLPYQGDYGVTNYPDAAGTKVFPALRLETIIAMGLGAKTNAAGNYPATQVLVCPTAEGGGARHYQSNVRLIPNFQGINPSYYNINNTLPGTRKIGSVRRTTEVIMFYEATRQMYAGDAGFGNVDTLTYNLDSSRMFWDPTAFLTSTSGYQAQNPVVTDFNTNYDAKDLNDGNRGRLRFRHNGNKVMNAVFLDGHAEGLRGKFDGSGRILNGGDVKMKHFYINP